MKNTRTTEEKAGRGLFWVLLFCLAGPAARAQSGPYGNEWIVPSQQYYKVKVTRDGIHRLTYQYLTQAGLSNIDPSRLQLWRRGREVAVYQGGARTAFDANTYLEFYGQRNDGQLDRDLYKNAADQPHKLYSFYTDTAAYFLTYPGATAPAAKRMAEPVAAGGTPHAWRLANSLKLETNVISEAAHEYTYLPWLEPGEGFFSQLLGGVETTQTDSVLRAVVTTGAAPTPRLELRIVGGTDAPHNIEALVLNPTTNTYRSLARFVFYGYGQAGGKYALQRAEIGANGLVTVRLSGSTTGTGTSADYFRRAFIRVVAPQANRWLGPRRQLAFASDSLLGGPATFELDSIPVSVVGYDVHDPWNVQRIAPVNAQTLGPLARRFVFPSATAAQSRRLLLADAQLPLAPPLPAQRVRFRSINQATVNFAIISHRQLFGPAMDGATSVPNAAREYAKYRASTAGGSYDTLLITTAQLYDQFHYGERSWLAMRHFGLWLAAGAPNNPNRYLLLLGKGIVPSEALISGSNRTINTFTTARITGERGVDLVPTSSRAVSDNMLTANFQANDFVPKLRTGRLTVTTPQQVMSYLGKLRTHVALGPEPWRKNVLHLIGGYDPNETVYFRSIMDRNKARVERPLLGGHVSTEFRVTPNRLPVSINISGYLNAGISLMTYFGHGSNNTFALNFGVPSDPANNYNNRGRYPFFFINGCAANHTFTTTPTIIEDWLFADQKGALGSLGEYGISYPDRLAASTDTIYKLLFNDPQWYGKPITAVQGEVVRRLQNTNSFSDNIGIEQLLATGWQGDPALALFAPERPDFVASAAALSITPVAGQGPVRAASSQFVLNVGVSNPGKITYDPVEIKVTRTVPGRPAQVYPLFTRRQAWGRDTTYALTLPNTLADAGNSTFQVVLDPNNKVPELSETNNTAQIDFTFLQGGLTVINPTEFAIVTTTQPRLVVQSNDRNGPQRGYDFELDTVPTFSSGRVVRAPLITAGVVAEWRPVLPAVAPLDSVVWYWRVRFHTPGAGEDASWTTSSFRVIPSSPGGWSQSHYGQLQRTTRTGVDVSAPAGAWAFVPNRVPMVLRTRGGGAPRSPAQFGSVTGAGIYLQSVGSPPSVSGCGVRSPNLLVAVYEPAGLRPVAMPAAYQQCGQAPNFFYYFSASDPTGSQGLDTLDNLNYSAARQQQLATFLAAVPAGSYVAVLSANRLRYSLLPASLKATLQTLLGSQLITQLADGEPLALVGQKLTASTGRLLHEAGPDRTQSVPTYDQGIELRDTLQQRATAGRVVSPRIGPAKEWLSLYSTIRAATAGGYRTLSVVAIDSSGRETTVLPKVTSSAQPLAAVSATQYPYLRLELALGDSVTRIPPQLRQWLVTYRGLPEGVVRRDSVPAASYAAATLAQQAISSGTISFPVKFQNVSDVAFLAPLKTRVNLRNTLTNNVLKSIVITLPGALAAGTTVTIPVSLDVKGLFGTFAIEVFVNPRLVGQPEQSYANNELLLDPFTVLDNNVPPTLDVAFDGRHILNGELVSPTPVINIQLNDEDKLNPITDRTVFTVTLAKPGQTGPPALVNLNGPEINFSVDATNGSVAKLEYRPGLAGPLADGMYTLRVQGRDPRNATAGSQDLQIKFEVVNASKITNVYPYPNPVISKARFVFTVTGQELPRNMKIQIMTLTGRVVREIFMNELGPLHIGNNITDFAWDGTDSFGDRLANGTYLYRVSLDDPGAQFGRRETAGDQAFKNDWGKLVLMR